MTIKKLDGALIQGTYASLWGDPCHAYSEDEQVFLMDDRAPVSSLSCEPMCARGG